MLASETVTICKIAITALVFVIAIVVLIVTIVMPLRSERELTEREKAECKRRQHNTDVLNVESKGGN